MLFRLIHSHNSFEICIIRACKNVHFVVGEILFTLRFYSFDFGNGSNKTLLKFLEVDINLLKRSLSWLRTQLYTSTVFMMAAHDMWHMLIQNSLNWIPKNSWTLFRVAMILLYQKMNIQFVCVFIWWPNTTGIMETNWQNPC